MILDDEDQPTSHRDALESMTADSLKKLAALTGERPPSRKADLISLILRHLDGERLQKVWESLDELQRAAVAEVVHSPTAVCSACQFRAKYGGDPAWSDKGKSRYDDAPTPLRFFFYGRSMPRDLKKRLEGFVPKPRPVAIDIVDPLPSVYKVELKVWNESLRIHECGIDQVPLAVHERDLAAQRELISVLRLVDSGKVAVSDKTRKASTATIAAITALLEGGDYYPYVKPVSDWEDENAGPIRAFAWPLLIQAGGLAQLSGSRLQLTRSGRKALSDSPAATLRALWKKWADSTMLDELSRIDCVKGQTGKGKRCLTAVSPRRGAVAGSLAECAAGKWILTEDFWRYMRATAAGLEVTRGDAWGLYIGELQYGSLGYDGNDSILNGRYLLALLLEYVSTLGMIDVALIPPAAGARNDFRGLWGTDELSFFSRYDGLMYLRLTPLGAYCLDVKPGYQPAPLEARPVLSIRPNLGILAGPDLEQSDRLALDAYATRVSESIWALESGKLLAAIEAGKQLEEIREFLVARSGEALPETVVHLLDDTATRTTMFRDVGLARLIECADSSLAAMIANDSRARKHCTRAGDKHLVVPAASETAFRRALRESGFILLAARASETAGNGRRAKDRAGDPPLEES